jgi:hypothetical protein
MAIVVISFFITRSFLAPVDLRPGIVQASRAEPVNGRDTERRSRPNSILRTGFSAILAVETLQRLPRGCNADPDAAVR